MRERGIAPCADLMLNHRAREHDRARRALAGDAQYLDYDLTYPDRERPDAFERTLPEIFPDEAPRSLNFVPEMAGGGRWVWTTFYSHLTRRRSYPPGALRAALVGGRRGDLNRGSGNQPSEGHRVRDGSEAWFLAGALRHLPRRAVGGVQLSPTLLLPPAAGRGAWSRARRCWSMRCFPSSPYANGC